MATISQIAAELGLSKSTVSRALRGLPNVAPETVEAVRQAAAKMGYVPSVAAAGLSTGRNHAIGVVVPSLNRWFYTSVLTGISRALAELGYDVVLFDLDRNLGEGPRVFVRSLLRRRVDALIVVSAVFTDEEFEEFALLDIPMIAVGPPAPGFRSIGVDDAAIMTTIMDHVLGLGHRRIGFLGGLDSESLNVVSATERESVFTRMAQEAGAVVEPEWVLLGGYRNDLARQAAGRLFESDSYPTALVCTSDEMAIGAMFAIHAAGLRVPEDVSVTGVDDHEYAAIYNLTTCWQNAQAQGAQAARQVVAEIEGAEPPESFAPAPFLFVPRGTTAPPPATQRARADLAPARSV